MAVQESYVPDGWPRCRVPAARSAPAHRHTLSTKLSRHQSWHAVARILLSQIGEEISPVYYWKTCLNLQRPCFTREGCLPYQYPVAIGRSFGRARPMWSRAVLLLADLDAHGQPVSQLLDKV